jgi:hypothetical protein
MNRGFIAAVHLIPNSEVTGVAVWMMPCRSAPVPGRSNWLHSSHGTFTQRSPTPPGCGRDGRTPPTQKFNFGVMGHPPLQPERQKPSLCRGGEKGQLRRGFWTAVAACQGEAQRRLERSGDTALGRRYHVLPVDQSFSFYSNISPTSPGDKVRPDLPAVDSPIRDRPPV